MNILMLERDVEEMSGIEWYLKTYLSYDIQVKALSDASLLAENMSQITPDVLLVELELINPYIEEMLSQMNIPIIAITGEPIFQQAIKAVNIHAYQLFVKPLPLEKLKSTLLALPRKKESTEHKAHVDPSLYETLYFHDDRVYPIDQKTFFLIECAHFEDNLTFYHWLTNLPIFNDLTALPLQKRILCLVDTKEYNQLIKQIRLVMQEWEKTNDMLFNVAIYNGEATTLSNMYNGCKRALMRRFYEGYAHIFKSSDTLQITRLDPLLSFEAQQLWITSLDKGDIQAIKSFLYALTKPGTFYHQEDVRIHLTSILAQIRRYMQKYQLQNNTLIEKKYRELFHFILEYPVLYTIIQQFILFTQFITAHVKKIQQQQQLADYAELAVSFIEQHYEDTDLCLQQVAEALSISPNYLSNMFSKKRGIPFKKFLQQYRLQRAAHLLVTTNQSISAVAEAVGFVDHNYFSKVFRRYYQTTPYRYRLQQKNKAQNEQHC